MIIDNELFRIYSICKYKGLLKYSGKNGIISDFDTFQRQKEIEYRAKVIKEIEKKKRRKDVQKMKFVDNIDLQTEKNFLLGIKIKYKNIHIYIDTLDKVRGKSSLGSFSYIPYIFVPKNKVGKHEKLFLAFIAYVIGMAEKRVVRHGVIIYGVHLEKHKVDLIKYQDTVACLIEQISGLSKIDQQPRLILNKHCTICEFQKICEKEAREKDDLSLLRGMTGKEIETQISKGIFTVTQYSYTFRPRKRRKKETNHSKRRYHALQALAIREKKIFIFGEPNIPTSTVSIYMDIETDVNGLLKMSHFRS